MCVYIYIFTYIDLYINRSDGLWGPLSLLFRGYRCCIQGLKRPGSEVDQPPRSCAEVKNERISMFTSPGQGLLYLYFCYLLITSFLSEENKFSIRVSVKAHVKIQRQRWFCSMLFERLIVYKG